MAHVKETLSFSHVAVPATPLEAPDLKTVPDCLQHYAELCPTKEAVIFAATDGGREAVTFKEVYDKSKLVAHNLLGLGVKPDEIVAINLRTCPEWLYIAFGSMMMGAKAIGASFTYTDGSDLIALMEKLGTCSCLVMDPGVENEKWNILSELVEEYTSDGRVASKQMPTLRYLLRHDPENKMEGVKRFAELLEDNGCKAELPKIKESDIAALFQTSGSTGVPKIVVHTHTSLLTLTRSPMDEFTSKYRYFCERSFSWIGGYPLNVAAGQTRITYSGFCAPPSDKAAFLLDVVIRETCHVLSLVPSTLLTLNAKEQYGDAWPAKSMVLSGQPLTRQAVMSIMGRLCDVILTAYGGTEFLTASMTSFSDPAEFVEHSCGYIVPGMEVRIVDTEEGTVPVNTCGEIFMKSKSLFREYYNDPEKTTAAFTEDGWFRSDDLGRMLKDGSLLVEGRKSNLILSGRMSIAPEILEKLISRCPGVQACILVPVPDDVMYQVICACVKAVPGSDANEESVRKFCEEAHADKLGVFTVLPKFYLFLESFPETGTGKVSRKDLTRMAVDAFKK